MTNVDILLEQPPCLVVAKPAGVLTQAPAGIDSLEWRVREYLFRRDGRPRGAHLGVVHRLDRPASGALLLGLTRVATRALSRQVAERQVQKVYWALAEGSVEPATGTWTDHMRKVPGEARAELVPPDHPGAKQADLQYRVRGVGDNWTWIEIVLGTGRTHQVRLQAASRGHPVLGDTQYGAVAAFEASAIALHARSLGFRHPRTDEIVTVVAPTPSVWDAFVP